MNRFTPALLIAALLTGCQSTPPSTSKTRPAEPGKAAVASTSAGNDTARVSTPATADVETARLAEIARAAAEGKATATPLVPAAPAKAALPASPHDKPGFVTRVVDGRLWVFKDGAKELADFAKHGELEKSVTRVGVGPDGMTVRGPDAATIDAYLATGK